MKSTSNIGSDDIVYPGFATVNTADIIPSVGTVGDYIRARRKELGLTQEQLAERAQMAQNTLSEIERGAISIPRHTTLVRLSNALEVSVASLYVATGAAKNRDEGAMIADAMPAYDPADPRGEIVELLNGVHLSRTRTATLHAILGGWIEEDRATGRGKGR